MKNNFKKWGAGICLFNIGQVKLFCVFVVPMHALWCSLTCFGTSVARERADIRTLLFLLNKKLFNGRIIVMNTVLKHFPRQEL